VTVIYQRRPKSKVVSVTQDGNADLRNASVRVGEAVYGIKANAARGLLAAITTASLCR